MSRAALLRERADLIEQLREIVAGFEAMAESNRRLLEGLERADATMSEPNRVETRVWPPRSQR